MGWINRIRNIFGMGDSQDPSHRPASTHNRAGGADGKRLRARRKPSGGHGTPALRQPPAAPTPQMEAADLREAALQHHKQKHWAKAAAFWQRLYEVAPDHSEDPQLGLVICLFNLDRVEEARKHFAAPGAPATVRLEAAHYFLAHQDYNQALPLWRSLATEKEAAEMHAPAWRMRCLLELGQEKEAKFLYEAPDAGLEELSVAANFLQQGEQWAQALKLWLRFRRGSDEEQAAGVAGEIRCLMELGRSEEAAPLYTAEKAGASARLAAADYFFDHERHEEALPWYRQAAEQSPAERPAAMRGQVLCLLNLAQDEEVKTLLASKDAPLEALRAAAVYFHEAERWEEALGVDRTIAERSEEDRAAAEGFQVTCLLKLERETEARALFGQHESRPQCRRAAAEFFSETQRFDAALPLWTQLAELPDYRGMALRNQVYCLLHLDREPEAEPLFTPEDADLGAVLGAANFYFNAERFNRALPLWRRVAAIDRSLSDPVAGKVVACLLSLGMEQEARRLYEPDQAANEALLAAADFWMFPDEGAPGAPSDYRSAKSYSQALTLWERLIARNSEYQVRALRGKLGCLLSLERFDEGMALVRSHTHPMMLLDASLFFCLSQRWAQALPLLDEVLARDGELRDRALAFKVTGLLSLERFAEAAKLYDAGDAPISVTMAAADYFRERGQWDTALSLFRRLTGKNSDGDDAGIGHQVDCLLWLGRDAEAAQIYGGAHPPQQALVAAGNFFADNNRWTEALAVWQRLDRSDVPFRAQAQAHLAGTLLHLNRKEEAEAQYLAADAAPEVVYAAGSVLMFLRDWAGALTLAERRLKDRRPALRQFAETLRLRSLIRLGRLAEARPLFTAGDADFRRLDSAGHELMQCGQFAEALAVWREMHRRFPQSDGHAVAQIAYCLLELGQTTEAETLYVPADTGASVLAAVGSYFDAHRQYPEAAVLHKRLIAAEPGANSLLGYFKNRVAAGDFATLDGQLSADLFAALEPACRRHDVNAYRQALWLPLAKGRFDEVLAKSLAVERRMNGGWRQIRCHELQLISAALAGARKPFEKALKRYSQAQGRLDDSVTLPDIVRQLAEHYGVLVDPAITERLQALDPRH